MIISDKKLQGAPVMSLQTGTELARVHALIIDPADLRIVALGVTGGLVGRDETILRLADVREFGDLGMIIDSADEFISPTDVIAIHAIYQLNFNLYGMLVLDEHRKKIGHINGFTIDTNDFTVQQLNIKRPFFKSLNDTELLIHRSQIVEINDRAIIIHSKADIPEPTVESIRQSYINPFRRTPAPEQIQLR